MIDPKRYPAEVFFSDEDEGYIALARDLPGCSAFGETQEEALAELQHAIEAWQLAAQAAGNPIPEPSKPTADPLPSGRILLRTPRSLHAALIEVAKQEAVSLNQHLVSVLSASTATSLFAAYSRRAMGFELFHRTGSSSFARFDVWLGPQLDRAQTVVETVDTPKFLIAATSEQARKHEHG